MSFAHYMDWALHDSAHGAYGCGHLRVAPRGDFATSPSLGPQFARLLAPQIADWLGQLPEDAPLALLEAGPGEGDLAADLAAALAAGWPHLAARLELVLIEPNAGMAARQRQRLAGCPLPVRSCSFADLARAPLVGVLLAHEVLDALAVERVVWDGAHWRRQLVALDEGASAEPCLRLVTGQPLDLVTDAALWSQLQTRGLLSITTADAQLHQRGVDGGGGNGCRSEAPWAGPSLRQALPAGWTTELQAGVEPWLRDAAMALQRGQLLVVDYALDARRYNISTRVQGTLMAYRGQRASGDPLLEPGHWDLTAHLCLECLDVAAIASGWQPLGQRRQGEALLALGLAAQLHGLQQTAPGDLAAALAAREALLRLVDPAGLGEFRWIAYSRGMPEAITIPLFLRDPTPSTE